MRDDLVRRAFGTLDEPARPSREFTDALFERLQDEMDRPPRRLPARRLPSPGSGHARRILAIAAAITVAVLSVAVLLGPLRGLLSSRTTTGGFGPFGDVPSFDATFTGVIPPGNHETYVGPVRFRVQYRGPDAWRITIEQGHPSSLIPAGAGSFGVWNGSTLKVYDATRNTYSSIHTPLPLSPLNVIGWTTAWERACGRERVVRTEDVAGRTADRVRCPSPAGQAREATDLWVDAQTGLLLKMASYLPSARTGSAAPEGGPILFLAGERLEAESVGYDPPFARTLFRFAPPPGSRSEAEFEASQPPTSLTIGEVAPTWSGPLLDGGTLDLASLRGKPTAVFFWASWCDVCLTPLPGLETQFERLGNQVNIVTVAHADEPSMASATIKAKGYRFPVVAPGDVSIGTLWGLQSVPTLVVLDGEGRFAGAYEGSRCFTDNTWSAIIGDLAAGKPPPDLGLPIQDCSAS